MAGPEEFDPDAVYAKWQAVEPFVRRLSAFGESWAGPEDDEFPAFRREVVAAGVENPLAMRADPEVLNAVRAAQVLLEGGSADTTELMTFWAAADPRVREELRRQTGGTMARSGCAALALPGLGALGPLLVAALGIA